MDVPPVTIDLLDESQTASVQTWKFVDRRLIEIGRADENDLVIRQPTVSRRHAQLYWGGDRWSVVNLSRIGTVVNGYEVAQAALCDEAVIQLGPTGPVLQVNRARDAGGDPQGTVSALDLFNLPAVSDAAKREQVEGVVESTFFKGLQRLARQLRPDRG